MQTEEGQSHMEQDVLQIAKGTEEEIRNLVEKMDKVYKYLEWKKLEVLTDDGEEWIGYKISFDWLVVEVGPKWWGTWIRQYCISINSHEGRTNTLHAAIHKKNTLYDKIKEIQEYAHDICLNEKVETNRDQLSR